MFIPMIGLVGGEWCQSCLFWVIV